MGISSQWFVLARPFLVLPTGISSDFRPSKLVLRERRWICRVCSSVTLISYSEIWGKNLEWRESVPTPKNVAFPVTGLGRFCSANPRIRLDKRDRLYIISRAGATLLEEEWKPSDVLELGSLPPEHRVAVADRPLKETTLRGRKENDCRFVPEYLAST